ncbi:hypothetical protein Dimus_036772, partial [Dionaea muscipula]
MHSSTRSEKRVEAAVSNSHRRPAASRGGAAVAASSSSSHSRPSSSGSAYRQQWGPANLQPSIDLRKSKR